MNGKINKYFTSHQQLSIKYRKLFKFMDILIALVILMNFGTVFCTNAISARAKPIEERVFIELNPVQAETYDLPTSPGTARIFKMIMIQMFFWFFFLLGYVYFRMTISTRWQLIVMFAFVIWMFSAIGWNFCSDAGFWFGVIIYG